MCVCNVIDGFYKIVTQEKFKEYILAVICYSKTEKAFAAGGRNCVCVRERERERDSELHCQLVSEGFLH